MRVLLDTNFLVIPGKFKVDVFSELEKFGKPQLFTLDLVIKELDRLALGKGRDAAAARLGLSLIKKNKIEIINARGKNTDSEIERIASEDDFIVCTVDKELIRKLKREGVKIIFLRQKKKLEFWVG